MIVEYYKETCLLDYAQQSRLLVSHTGLHSDIDVAIMFPPSVFLTPSITPHSTYLLRLPILRIRSVRSVLFRLYPVKASGLSKRTSQTQKLAHRQPCVSV